MESWQGFPKRRRRSNDEYSGYQRGQFLFEVSAAEPRDRRAAGQDTLLRVFMAWKPLDKFMEIPAQSLTAPERTGFTAVEWGGCRVR